MLKKYQRGQALILIALAFLGLVAFIGLTVDAGILFVSIGHLRRAVDAAGIAAASQYLADTNSVELMATVKEFLELNGIDPDQPNLKIEVCNLPGDPDFSVYHEDDLCKENNPWDYDRKLVRVKAELPVYFAFLPVIGFRSIDIKAETIAEAASVDLVLVIDASQSMADDLGPFPDCNDVYPMGTCQPFETVRASAKEFVKSLAFPYDHVAVVSFSAEGLLYEISAGNVWADNYNDAETVINNMVVYEQSPCMTLPDPGGCLSTNIAGGLRGAHNAFAYPTDPARNESLWVVVLLSDGSANQAWDGDTSDWICPTDTPAGGFPDWIQPYCVDGDGDTRHADGDPWYDADDATKDVADLIGCYQDLNPDQSAYCQGAGINGDEALIFAIGMGEKIVNGDCDTWYADNGETCHVELGARLLRYIAAVGDDGNPLSNLCEGVSNWKQACGNYYFAQTASDLDPVFKDIGKRVYTKITH